MALHVGHNCVPWGDCDVCGAKVEPQYHQRTDVCGMCGAGFTVCRCRHQLREWRENMSAKDRDLLDEIKTKWNFDITLPMAVPWGKDDVAWLVGEIERLRGEAERADEEATMLANSDLATTEQVIRVLRAENERLMAQVVNARGALADIADSEDEHGVPSTRKWMQERAEGVLDALRAGRDTEDRHTQALRLLATRVEAKRLDEAQEEIARLRAACTLALRVMEQTNRVTVPPFAKFITVDFAPEDVAVLRAALEKKP